MEDRRELLRFMTAGSVDDGKSTLIGRLLNDANSIFQDQLAALLRAVSSNPTKGLDFSLVTDGLRAEREQGITIDVAYRYFSTPRRKFIIADTPGHEQYTRNMATGASTATLAVLLVDARKGALIQTRRHAVIAWLLGIRDFVVAVNKMDLVDFHEDVFGRIEQDMRQFMTKLGAGRLQFVPTCAPDGDNIVHRSKRAEWFHGPTLLEYLETTPIAADHDIGRLRFPVQNVIRKNGGHRRYAGQVASGVLRPGDSVLAMPSGRSAQITSIRNGDQELECAFPPLSVSVALNDEIDIGRGDMLVDPASPAEQSRSVTATVLWMNSQPLEIGRPYLIKHTSKSVCASIVRLNNVLNPSTLQHHPATALKLNEFGEVEIETHQPLSCDPYVENRVTGSFILIDPMNNETLGAGMIAARNGSVSSTPEVTSEGVTVWLTGLSSSGKTTIAQGLYEKLWAKGFKLEWLDGDVVRQHLNKGLGFSKEDRDENIRRIGFLAELLTRNGVIVLVSAISPYRATRDEVRQRIGNFVEVYVQAPLATCEQRDLKGIYRQGRAGELSLVTGLDDPYEPPLNPDVVCRTDRENVAECVANVLEEIERRLVGKTAKDSRT